MRAIFLTFLGVAVISAPASAQPNQQRCAELKAELAAIEVEMNNADPGLEKVYDALFTADRRSEAIEGAYGSDVFGAVSNAEPYAARAMRQFREENGLPAELENPIRAERPAEFWRRAAAELRRIARNRIEPFFKLADRRRRNENEYFSLKCREASGPLPIERRPDDQPIITDPLITRWVKARYALANTGGSYWQAGQMTQQDYFDVDRRFQLYFDLLNGARMAEQFSDNEMRAMNLRVVDIRNVREGNWSQIKF